MSEGKLIVAALDFGKVNAKSVRAKLGRAIELATHECTGNVCPICDAVPENKMRLKEYRAKVFQEALTNAAKAKVRETAAIREEALMRGGLKLKRDDAGGAA